LTVDLKILNFERYCKEFGNLHFFATIYITVLILEVVYWLKKMMLRARLSKVVVLFAFLKFLDYPYQDRFLSCKQRNKNQMNYCQHRANIDLKKCFST
jgi:hypothetical protein